MEFVKLPELGKHLLYKDVLYKKVVEELKQKLAIRNKETLKSEDKAEVQTEAIVETTEQSPSWFSGRWWLLYLY